MSFFTSVNNNNICGKLDLPSGSSGNIKLLIIDPNNTKQEVPFIHDRSVLLENGQRFTTVTDKITNEILPKLFVIYVDDENPAWVLENSITVNIYRLSDNQLLATKVIGKLDEVISFEVSNYINKPCIVFSRCDNYNSTLRDDFLKVEFISHCDRSADPPCCDSLPESISVSGYSTLCIPLRDFYDVPNFITTTTTLPPPEDQIKIIYQPFLFTSSDVDHFYVKAHIKTKYSNKFSYWWERSEDNISWERVSDVEERSSDTEISLLQIKKQDYYYRVNVLSPSQKYSNSVFYRFVDRYAPTTTTTTTTTTATPEPITPPSSPLDIYSSGGFREVFLSWNEPLDDGNLPINGYSLQVKRSSDNSVIRSTGISPLLTEYYVPISSTYDGVLLDLYLQSSNLFGYSDPAIYENVSTLSKDPPSVSNVVVIARQDPDRFELDWDTGGFNEIFPLLSHSIQFRPSGSSDQYTSDAYSDTATQATINDVNTFDDCEVYEFTVVATNAVGDSVPATGYARMGFLPDAPEDLNLTMTPAAEEGYVDLDFSWNPPTYTGRCDLLTTDNYVYQYKLSSESEWRLPIVVSATSVQTNSVPSGDYVFRTAAINIVGTGNYAYYGDWVLVGNTIDIPSNSDQYRLSLSLAVTDDLHTIVDYTTNNSANVYNFNGCDWILNTSLLAGSRLSFANNNSSIVTYHSGTIKVYDNTNDTWSLSSTKSISLSYGSIGGIFSNSDDLSYIVGGYDTSVSMHRLGESSYQDMNLSTYLPVDTAQIEHEIIRACISNNGSRLAVLFAELDTTTGASDFYVRIFNISGSSLSQSGNDIQIVTNVYYIPGVDIGFSNDSNSFIAAYADPFFSENSVVLKYEYDLSSNSWITVLDESISNDDLVLGGYSLTGEFITCYLSKDSTTLAIGLPVYRTSDGQYSNLVKCFDVSTNSITDKGSTFNPEYRIDGMRLSDDGNVMIIQGFGKDVLSVYRYAAADITLPPCT